MRFPLNSKWYPEASKELPILLGKELPGKETIGANQMANFASQQMNYCAHRLRHNQPQQKAVG